MRVGIVVPHIFMQRDILPQVIFSPGELALWLADRLVGQGIEVTLFTPGAVDTEANNVTADLTPFQRELDGRGDTYLELLKKHPLTFISLARQVQSQLIADAFRRANDDQLDVVHIYTNEEDIALPFAQFCTKPTVFTHHDPFSFLIKYKHVFPKYKHLNWISMSYAQRQAMPRDTNWVANIYHGLNPEYLKPVKKPANDYVAYLGRIIEPKGVHLAIKAVELHNAQHPSNQLVLKIAGKHYDDGRDSYWQSYVAPAINDGSVEYVGYIKDTATKQQFLGNARALLMPSTWDEPFGMVAIESLASGTPVIGLDSGALPEIITEKTGMIVPKQATDSKTAQKLSRAISNLGQLKRSECRQDFEARFTLDRMAREHAALYQRLTE